MIQGPLAGSFFNATVAYSIYPCGGYITAGKGTIYNPGYPAPLNNVTKCSWLLTQPEKQIIRLKFDKFEMSCEEATLKIYNGAVPTAPRIGEYCNNIIPNVIDTQGNAVLVEFDAKRLKNGQGFKFSYEPRTKGCGGILHDNSNSVSDIRPTIETPSYPESYPNNTECIWEIVAYDGYILTLYFFDRFYLESTANCTNDYVEVSDWVNEQWTAVGRYCGRELPQSINSTSNKIMVRFKSNDKINGQGFRASWNTTCGGTIKVTSEKQYLVSPGYPMEYRGNLNCVYKFVAVNNNINIRFEDFALEQG